MAILLQGRTAYKQLGPIGRLPDFSGGVQKFPPRPAPQVVKNEPGPVRLESSFPLAHLAIKIPRNEPSLHPFKSADFVQPLFTMLRKPLNPKPSKLTTGLTQASIITHIMKLFLPRRVGYAPEARELPGPHNSSMNC